MIEMADELQKMVALYCISLSEYDYRPRQSERDVSAFPSRSYQMWAYTGAKSC